MNFSFEPAKSSDIDGMNDLLTVLLNQEADFTPNDTLQKKGLQLILNNPKVGKPFVAKADNKIIAMVNLLFTVSTALGNKVAILEDMVVLPEFRNKAIGSKLIETAIAFAKKEGFSRITLLTDSDNFKAHKFYNKHGFDKSNMVAFRKIIE